MPDFSLAAGRMVRGDYAVYPNSLLFTAGAYPDKNISVSEQDIAAIAAGWRPVPFNVEHSKHGAHQAMAGLYGGILRSWVDPDDPKNLRGEVAVPLIVDAALETRAPSLEFNAATKEVIGAALTYTPRVSEAAFMSAVAEFATHSDFAMTRHNTPEGQMVIQDIHDTAARGGAICERPKANMSSQHEATGIQKIHDEAVKHGADCSKGDKPDWAKSMFSAIHSSHSDLDKTIKPASPVSAKGAKTMPNFWDKLTAHLTKLGVPAEEIQFSQEDFATLTPVVSGMTEAEKAQFSQATAELTRLRAENVQIAATAFAAAAVSEGKALPAERDDLIAEFTQAAEDDAAAPKTINFTQDGKAAAGSRVDALKARIAKRPVNNLSRELVQGATYFSLHTEKGTTKDQELDRVEKDARAWAEKQNNTGANRQGANAAGRN